MWVGESHSAKEREMRQTYFNATIFLVFIHPWSSAHRWKLGGYYHVCTLRCGPCVAWTAIWQVRPTAMPGCVIRCRSSCWSRAKLRADEIFEAVYVVAGHRSAWFVGTWVFRGSGPTFDERRGASHRDDWHQGEADGYALRFCAGPVTTSMAAAMGMGQYYDLVAEGFRKNEPGRPLTHW